jgi:excisionase family DNA binding protein
MKAHYDREANAAYIAIGRRRKVATTERASHDVRVDFDADGYVVGFELLNAREHFGPGVHKLPRAVEDLSLAEAAERSGLSPTTLRLQIHNGRLKARKRGRDWVVSAAQLENYLEAVEAGRASESLHASKPRKARKQPSRTVRRVNG